MHKKEEEKEDSTSTNTDTTIVTTNIPTTPDSSEPSNIIPDTSILTSVASTTTPESSGPLIECNIGYKLVNGKCFIDYIIKAIYLSKANENIRLISDEYSLNKIRKMIIDGKIVNPTKNFTFNENGRYTILYSFFPFNISTKIRQLEFLMELKTY